MFGNFVHTLHLDRARKPQQHPNNLFIIVATNFDRSKNINNCHIQFEWTHFLGFIDYIVSNRFMFLFRFNCSARWNIKKNSLHLFISSTINTTFQVVTKKISKSKWEKFPEIQLIVGVHFFKNSTPTNACTKYKVHSANCSMPSMNFAETEKISLFKRNFTAALLSRDHNFICIFTKSLKLPLRENLLVQKFAST